MLRSIYLALWSTVLFVSADTVEDKSLVSNQEIHRICQINYAKCVTLLPEQLLLSVEGSRVWYALKLYQLEALFALERLQQLRAELEPLVKIEHLPTKFKVHSYVLYAKLIKSEGQEELAVKYINQAKETLLAVSEDWPKPIEFVQIANILNTLEEYQQGYDMLLVVEKRFNNHRDPNFRYQLYTNLGHFSYGLGMHQQHINYRFQAREWAEKGKNKNQLAIAVFNIARAHFFINKNQIAREYFEQMLPIAREAENYSLLNNAYINIADTYARQKNNTMVRATLNHVKQTKFSGNYLNRYEDLKRLLSKRPGDKPGKK